MNTFKKYSEYIQITLDLAIIKMEEELDKIQKQIRINNFILYSLYFLLISIAIISFLALYFPNLSNIFTREATKFSITFSILLLSEKIIHIWKQDREWNRIYNDNLKNRKKRDEKLRNELKLHLLHRKSNLQNEKEKIIN